MSHGIPVSPSTPPPPFDHRVRTIARGFGLHQDDVTHLADLLALLHLHQVGRLDPGGRRRAGVILERPDVVKAVVDSHEGPLGLRATDDDLCDIESFASAVLDEAARPRAGAFLLLARAAEARGDVERARDYVTTAVRADPAHTLALAEEGYYAVLADELVRGKRCFERAGIPAFGLAGIAMHHALDEPGALLAKRAPLLYIKIGSWTKRPHLQRRMLSLACAAAGVETFDDAPDLVSAALTDDALGDLHLFGAGGVDGLVAELSPVLAGRDASLLQQWEGCQHSVWWLIDRPGDGGAWTVRDAVTNTTRQVLDMPGGPESWQSGTPLLGTLVPTGRAEDAWMLAGTVRSLASELAAELVELLSGHAPVAAFAAALIGPQLSAASATRDAAFGMLGDLRERATWLFPGERFAMVSLADQSTMDRLVARTFGGEALGNADGPLLSLIGLVAGQILQGEPEEVWRAARQLESQGLARADIMLTLAMVLWKAMKNADASSEVGQHQVELLNALDLG